MLISINGSLLFLPIRSPNRLFLTLWVGLRYKSARRTLIGFIAIYTICAMIGTYAAVTIQMDTLLHAILFYTCFGTSSVLVLGGGLAWSTITTTGKRLTHTVLRLERDAVIREGDYSFRFLFNEETFDRFEIDATFARYVSFVLMQPSVVEADRLISREGDRPDNPAVIDAKEYLENLLSEVFLWDPEPQKRLMSRY